MQSVADRGRAGYRVVPNNTFLDRNISGQCLDCFSPTMNHVPGGSSQYGLALTKFKDDGTKHRFRYGFIGYGDSNILTGIYILALINIMKRIDSKRFR